MVPVHGRDAAQRAAEIERDPAAHRLLVPVDVGKDEAIALVADSSRSATLELVGGLRAGLDRTTAGGSPELIQCENPANSR